MRYAPTPMASGSRAGVRLPFLLEYDTGSERLARLEAKLDGLRQAGPGRRPSDLGALPLSDLGRETSARRVLVHPEVPVATAVISPGAAPDGPCG